MRNLSIVVVLAVIALFGLTIGVYSQKPSDGPIFVSVPGKINVSDIKFSENRIERRLEFLDELNNSFSFKVDRNYTSSICNGRCRISYQEKWVFKMRSGFWRSTLTLISIEQL